MEGPIERATPVRIVVKAAALPVVNNSVVLVNDAELYFYMAANEVYRVEFLLLMDTSAGAKWSAKVIVPALATFDGRMNEQTLAGGQEVGPISEAAAVGGRGAGAGAILANPLVHGVVVNGANAGNFQIQFAQSVAEVSDTKIRENSYIIVWRL